MLEVILQSASRAAALHAAAFLVLGALLPSDAHGATSGVLDAARCAAADNTQQWMATMDRTINGEAGLPAYLTLCSESPGRVWQATIRRCFQILIKAFWSVTRLLSLNAVRRSVTTPCFFSLGSSMA